MDTERLYSVCGTQPTRLGCESHQQAIVITVETMWRASDCSDWEMLCSRVREEVVWSSAVFRSHRYYMQLSETTFNQAHPLCHLEVKLRVSQQSGWASKGKEEWRQTEFQLLSSEMQCVNMPHSLSFIWICLPGEKTICHKKIHSFFLINL